MIAPAVAGRAGIAVSDAGAARASPLVGGVRPRPRVSGAPLLLVVLLAPAGLVIGLVLLVATLEVTGQQTCGSNGTLPADFAGPGSLGGVGGTGISRALVDEVRSASPFAGTQITPGTYVSTAYGPPWGGIQGAGVSTSGGLPIGGGAPRWYMIAIWPALIAHGTFVYIWPNPFGWRGPFFAADTGGDIVGRRIDFYDWRGRAIQDRWGVRTVTVSARPIPAAGSLDAPAALEPVTATRGCGGEDLTVAGASGKVVLAPAADRPGVPTQEPVLDFLRGVAGIAGRTLIITTGSNHSQYASSGNESDHWVGLAADLGSVANGFAINGQGGTMIAAAALQAAGVEERDAWRLANAGGGHNVCHNGWRVQVIWRTGGHYDHVHVGLRRGCSFTGVQTFQI